MTQAAEPAGSRVSVRSLALAWAVALSLWGPLAMTMDLDGPPRPVGARVFVLLALLAVGPAATLVAGFLLGRRRLWRNYGWLVAAGTGVTMFWYDAAMLASSNPTSDTTAAVGTMILTPFVAGGLAVALGVSGLLGRWVRQRALPPPTPTELMLGARRRRRDRWHAPPDWPDPPPAWTPPPGWQPDPAWPPPPPGHVWWS